ncbi:hypothetical protein [Aeromonas veronii]|uniref:hypothetical protein n=1 Tax=Aeromonas veronii TaxID=654 RepID=UPI003D229FA5
MSQQHALTKQEIENWHAWLEVNTHIQSKINKPTAVNSDFFLSLHAATEAAFRRLLFIGLRLNEVTYKQANDFLFKDDKTPSHVTNQGGFIWRFNKLFLIKNISWDMLLETQQLQLCWRNWNDFSKIIRNHIAHGIRTYHDEWLLNAIRWDMALLYTLAYLFTPIIGGSPFSELDKIHPRLPKGRNEVKIAEVLGEKAGKTKVKPKMSLVSSAKDLELMQSFLNKQGRASA